MSVRLRVPQPTQDIRTIEPKPLPAGSTSGTVPLAKSTVQHNHSVLLSREYRSNSDDDIVRRAEVSNYDDSVARTHTVTYGSARPPAFANAGWVASNSRTWSSVLVRTWVGEVMQ